MQTAPQSMNQSEAVRDLILALMPFAQPQKKAAAKPQRADYARARMTLARVLEAIAAADVKAAAPMRILKGGAQ